MNKDIDWAFMTARVKPSMHKTVKARCAMEDISVSDLINRLLIEWLENRGAQPLDDEREWEGFRKKKNLR